MSTPDPTTISASTMDKPTKTSYLIFVEELINAGNGQTAWVEKATVEASSADAAIRKHLAGIGKDERLPRGLAAVPARSFTKRTPKTITETRLVLE